MKNYQFVLEPYKGLKTRYKCPDCKEARKFVRYIDSETGEHLPFKYGKCERNHNCGYHLNPYQDGYAFNHQSSEDQASEKTFQPKKRPQYFIPKSIFKNSLKGYEDNSFVQFLIRQLGKTSALDLAKKFQIGSSNYWPGATVFWLLDSQNRVAGGQIILFETNGSTKREKRSDGSTKRYNGWVHTALASRYKQNRKAQPGWLRNYIEHSPKYPCLFGLPQLEQEPITKPVAIVESAKTAIIASAYFPEYIWLAVGALSYLNWSRIKDLKGRKIALFPDKGGYEAWNQKATEFSKFASVIVSDLLERKNAKEGSDLADYLIQN